MNKPEHWNISTLEVGSKGLLPTYAAHSTRDMGPIEEIASALNAPYPHFLAVLTPERNFLHYILSGLVCNGSFATKDELFEHATRLYDANIEYVRQEYSQQAANISSRKNAIGELADEYTISRKFNLSISEQILEECLPFFEEKYNTLMGRIYTGYLPGMIDSDLDTLEKIFRVICEDECEREENQGIAWQIAQKVIHEDIAAGNIPALSEYDKDERLNVVMAGVIGSGKNYFLKKMEDEGTIHRKNFAFIDIDDLKWYDKIVIRDSHAPIPIWNKIAHDECHLIRRKIFDELDAKAKTGKAPNTLLLTSHLSERALNWLTHENPRVNIYLFTCTPDYALRNTLSRTQEGGRRMSTESVLYSVKNLATSTAYMLFQTTGGNRLFIQQEDTSEARTQGSKTVFKTHAGNELHIYDLQALIDSLKGYFVNGKAHGPEEAYLPFDSEDLNKRVKAVLRPHEIMFYNGPGESTPVATKGRDSGNVNIIGNVDEKTFALLQALDPTIKQQNMGRA